MVKDLSLGALSILAALAQGDVLAPEDLLSRVPYNEPHLGIDDIGAWFDCMQAVLDAGYVVRVELKDRFAFQITRNGLVYACAYMHPLVARQEEGAA